MNWELCPNLSFTVENKVGNLHKIGHISNLTWWIWYSIHSNFKNFVNDLEKICFPLEQNFEPIGNCAHTTGFLVLGKALLILLPLYLPMLIIQISTQTDNHKHRKSVATKKVHSLKKWVWIFETLNSTFYTKKHLFFL